MLYLYLYYTILYYTVLCYTILHYNIGFAGGAESFMDCWWFSAHSYCWTCGFRGPLGAQGAVGCPLATTHVNHFLREFVGVDFLGVDFLGVDLC